MRATKVITYQLDPVEVQDLLSKKRQYEDIIADKEPVKQPRFYAKKLDLKTYKLMRHEGKLDFEIAKYYGIKMKDLAKKKMAWGVKENYSF
ncbi:hypothetical protein [Halalkalibacter hemicellulosilyticus]|uniref:Uncharacterized protein n=1 Tax=Halalkalibacter hemicellulosilyticusJCM 9152 TaxID=1236971 RepID=W4QK37_9BACI|nr:hypothetical protein [Halalkalibacter hemicellulosilyticus]GAE32426.1 hypothetical protein JCM9152_3960 [Halalkalibacter hemicellulosilyticusJCM 9152]